MSAGRRLRLPSPAAVTLAGAVLAPLLFAWLAWRRRWVSDDGLIVVRVVRQILAGNGPVFNVLERAESNTSTLWTWLLALVGWLTGADVTRLAVYLGGILSVLGLALALDGSRRLHEERGAAHVLVPAGVLVVLAVFPFWDYATSGLETGLCTFWLAAIWWLLVTLREDATPRRQLVVALVIGLGPLVRPDFGLATVTFLVAAWLIVRPTWRRTLALVAAAAALPLAYQIFRAGYYGTLVPLPALAKGAAGSAWHRGLLYLSDFVTPYRLWIPFGLLLAILVAALIRRLGTPRERIIVVVPLVTALLMTLYVLRVGGDFMHGRMFLPPTLLLVLPALLLPLGRMLAPALLALGGWALWTGVTLADNHSHATSPLVEDERVGYMLFTGRRNPTAAKWFVLAAEPSARMVQQALKDGRRLLISEGGVAAPMNPAHAGPIVFAVGRLGTGGAVAPLEATVVDTLGLANPLGARITPTNPGITGHEKPLPWAWVLADFADPAANVAARFDYTRADAVAAARRAMRCGELAELLDSVRAPLTARRFLDNLTGSVARTALVIPADPFDAERKFCESAPATPGKGP